MSTTEVSMEAETLAMAVTEPPAAAARQTSDRLFT